MDLVAEPLRKAAFAPFGDVIETAGLTPFTINQGFGQRFNDLANVDVSEEGGGANVSVIVANPRQLPITLQVMERHPLGSQVFYPLQDRDWLVAVCADPNDARGYRVFRASGRQGVNYKKGAWHHPLLVFEPESRFLVVDRKGPGANLEEIRLGAENPLRIKP